MSTQLVRIAALHARRPDVLADAITDTARVEAEACGRPYRDRRGSLWAPMGVEVVAFISVWLRLYIRWTTLGGFESDDWAILVAVVSPGSCCSPMPLHLGT